MPRLPLPSVVYRPLDLSTGMASSSASGVAGYTPDYAVGIMKNLLISAAAELK